MTSAIVVGSGPNGLSAALTLARSGIEVTVLEAAAQPGGGARSAEATLPGLLHDECSGFHPLAVDNAFSRSVDLAAHGLAWEWPEIQYAHPLDHGGASAVRDVFATSRTLFDDGSAWARVFGTAAGDFRGLTDDLLRPMLRMPGNPASLARLGASAGLPASVLARSWTTAEARALFAGVAAHAFRPLDSLASSAVGVVLGSAAHACGWPVARGGSQSIVEAMIRALLGLGGRVETGIKVSALSELPPADLVLLDTSPAAAAAIAGERMPGRIARAYRRYTHGPGAFTVSFAVEGGIPWSFEPAFRAGTVHLGGTFEEIAAAERMVHLGRTKRLASSRQRLALSVRDLGLCQFPGCGRRRRLEAHHRQPWSEGGPTDLDNLVLLCRSHHIAVHEHHLRIARTDAPHSGARQGSTGFVFLTADGRDVGKFETHLLLASPGHTQVTIDWTPLEHPPDDLDEVTEVMSEPLNLTACPFEQLYGPDRISTFGGGYGFNLAECVSWIFDVEKPQDDLGLAA